MELGELANASPIRSELPLIGLKIGTESCGVRRLGDLPDDGGLAFLGRNSVEVLKKPAACRVTVTARSVSLSQYQPWMPGNGAM